VTDRENAMATPDQQAEDLVETQQPENLVESKREKKRAGLFARFLGRGGVSGDFATGGLGAGAGGAGGAGEVGGFAAAFNLGGILATKTGLLALALAAAGAVAGLGLMVHHFFGASQQATGGNIQLFAQKPKDGDSPAAKSVSYNGDSASLNYLSAANPEPGDAAPAAAPAPAASAPAPVDAVAAAPAAAASAENVPLNKPDAASGNGVNKSLLKNVGRFGEISKGGGLGSGFTPLGRVAPTGPIAAGSAASTAHTAPLTAMAKQAALAGGRSVSGRRFGGTNAARQAFAVQKDNVTAQTSAAGGTTYDGSAQTAAAGTGGNAGGGTDIGAGGVGSAPAQATALPNGASPTSAVTPPTTPALADACPWQNAIKTAQALIGVSVMLLLIASMIGKMKPYGMIIAKIIGFIVAGIGGMVIALGAQIASGQYGQKLQGGVLAAAGTGLIIAGLASGLMDSAPGANADASADAGADAGADASSSAGGGGSSGGGGGMFGGINPFVLLGGGAALIGLAGTMMLPPKQYPSKDFQNGTPPDDHWFGYREQPSKTALKKMVA
jgi:hypothetical protein